MIKAYIISYDQFKTLKNYVNIEKGINKIYEDIYYKEEKEEKDDINDKTNLNLVVLTSNPLLDENNNELRTINDFNSITSTIYELFNENKELILKIKNNNIISIIIIFKRIK